MENPPIENALNAFSVAIRYIVQFLKDCEFLPGISLFSLFFVSACIYIIYKYLYSN